MDSTTITGVASVIAVLIGGLVGSWVTRRNAQESTAVGGFAQLVDALQEQLDAQGKQIAALQTREVRRNRLARLHEQWDRQVTRKLNQLTDEDIPEPPPLDLTED